MTKRKDFLRLHNSGWPGAQTERRSQVAYKEWLVERLFPRIRLFTPELFAKVLMNERMRIEMSRIMRIFSREQSCSS